MKFHLFLLKLKFFREVVPFVWIDGNMVEFCLARAVANVALILCTLCVIACANGSEYRTLGALFRCVQQRNTRCTLCMRSRKILRFLIVSDTNRLNTLRPHRLHRESLAGFAGDDNKRHTGRLSPGGPFTPVLFFAQLLAVIAPQNDPSVLRIRRFIERLHQ